MSHGTAGVSRWVLGAAACAVLAGLSAASSFAGGGPSGKSPAPKPPAAPPPAASPAPAGTGTVSGMVTDEDGKPLAGATIQVRRDDAKQPWTATSDAKGFYAVRNLPTGKAAVTIRAKGRIPVTTGVKVQATGIAVADGKLLPGVRFAGKVVDTRDQPVGDVEVMAVPDRGDDSQDGMVWFSGLDFGDTEKSRPDGTFELDGLRPGNRYKLKLKHPRFLPLELPGLDAEAGGGHDHVSAILEDAAWLLGTVVDPAGKPVADVEVTGPDDGSDRVIVLQGITIHISMGPSSGPRTDAQGHFRMGSLPPGEEVRLTAKVKGFFPGELVVKDLTAGQEKSDVVIRLVAATATVSGVVVDDAGKPVAKAQVAARTEDDGDVGTAETDAQGRFTMLHVAARGPVLIAASAEGHQGGSTPDVALEAKDAKVELKRLGRLKIKVVGEDGKPIPQVTIKTLVDSAGQDRYGNDTEVTQGAQGAEAVLPLGSIEVTVAAEGYEDAAGGSFQVEPGQVVDGGTVTLTKKAEKPEKDR